MISGQMRRWRRLHRRIGLTPTFLLQARVEQRKHIPDYPFITDGAP